jgi:membrane protein DedA with SNARE-associated domain
MPELTAPIVNFSVEQVGAYGLAAIFILMILESACIPVPSEAIMLYGGFLVSLGEQEFVPVVVAGVAGNVVGSLLAYWLGAAKGREWLLRIRWLHVTERHLDHADRWFVKYGSWAVFLSRMMPIIRTFISLPAGIARMPLGRFTVLTILGCIPWVAALTLAGMAVGSQWEDLQHKLHLIDYLLVVVILVGGAWLLIRRRRRGMAVDTTGTT